METSNLSAEHSVEHSVDPKKKKNDTMAKKETSSRNDDMSQLFRKYLLPRTPQKKHNIGNTNIEESQVFNKSHLPRSRLLLNPRALSRPPSLLEQKLFPGLRCESEKLSTVSSANKGSKPQLTIFYDGRVTVYDNVSAEKAKEVMVILGDENSLPLNSVSDQEFNSKPKKDVLLSRKHSLQCFIEKRQARMVKKAPYALPCVPSNPH